MQPPPIKRQFRDPYGDWWDKQERRNYGEPVHEDYDQLGMFTPFEYTWTTPGKGLLQIGAFVAVFLSVCYTVKLTYPDRVAVPREFEDGLLKELGGAGAVRVSLLYFTGGTNMYRLKGTSGVGLLSTYPMMCNCLLTYLILQARSPEDAEAEYADEL